jgi:hypothetical protein
MLKKRPPSGFAPVLITFLLILLLLGLAIFLSPTFQKCIEQGASDSGHGKQSNKPVVEAFGCAISLIDSNHNLIVAIGTIVLAAFTVSLWSATNQLRRSTDRLWEAGERQIEVARKSAEAAVQSASVAERALTDLERPHVFFKRIFNGGPVIQSNGTRRYLRLAFVNRGRSVAILSAIRHNLCAFPNGQMPPPANPATDAGDRLPDWHRNRGRQRLYLPH